MGQHCRTLAAVGLLGAALLAGFRAEAQLHGDALAGFHGYCTVSQNEGQVSVAVRAENGSAVDLTGLTASHLTATTTGTAALKLVSTPVMRRELIRKNGHTFKWQGTLSGDGTVVLSTDVTAETPSGTTVTTGAIVCRPISITVAPTRTPRVAPTLRETRTPAATRTPRIAPTARPTRTPVATRTPRATLEPRPTKTPRLNAENPTNTARPTKTPRTPLPTRTPESDRPTRTPVAPTVPPQANQGAFRASCFSFLNGSSASVTMTLINGSGVEATDVLALTPQISATGTAVLSLGGAVPSRFSQITNGGTGRFRWDGTQTGDGSTAITVSARVTLGADTFEVQATCDPITTSVVATRTPVPTRTPQPGIPTRTPRPGPVIDPGAFDASCRLFESNGNVSVFLTVHNRTGASVTTVAPLQLSTQSAGEDGGGGAAAAAALVLSVGPSPGSYNILGDGANATFKWTGAITGSGTILVSTGATGVGLGGVTLETGLVECGTVGAEEPGPAPFDPSGLVARCTAGAFDGPILISFRLELVNGTGGELTNVTPFGPNVQTTGDVELTVTTAPKALKVVRENKSVRFKWQGFGSGRGLAFLHVGATATGPNGEAVSTGLIECNTLVIPPRPDKR